ncbi:phosphoribosyltransferase [Candidatus Chloroploca sp. M-50]|uniref:Orotate phosphoribosyltransferase n=1 Tax=Candidatus Chloroploca mongolica TaxID=2528176 RepID=A0ABS4D5R2_9CHLR|nr:phosphoribosyltransferase family protein [Candidatus Chloroploca mongolica]MBP1464774.1 phosphoribosyltransferase [Candidatus Chloroploca mongolica]
MEQDLLVTLAEVGALITNDHLVYTSGRHGSSYVNKDALYPHTGATSAVCARLAHHFAGAAIDVVAGPTVGGVIMAQWTAHHLSRLNNRDILAVYAEEEVSGASKQRSFRRGYDDLIRAQRILVVEDILTTGGSVRMVIEAVRAVGGTVVGVGALCNRGGITAAAIDAPDLFCLTSVPLESFDAEACPLCAAGQPINTRLGKGAAFLANQHVAHVEQPESFKVE